MPTARLQKLQDGQNGNVLKHVIGATQKFMEILVYASFRLCPHVVEGRIDIGSRTTI